VHLLLVTTCFPYDGINEFLDDEVWHLAHQFDDVTIAPMKPMGEIKALLPKNVNVDLALSAELGYRSVGGGAALRKVSAVVRSLLPCPTSSEVTFREFFRSTRKIALLKQILVGRADSKSVCRWATRRSTPSICYTFWLGPATVGLRLAYPKIPIVSRAHGGDVYPEASGWKVIPFQAAAVRSSTIVAAVSENGSNYLASQFAAFSDRVACRRLGIADMPRGSEERTRTVLNVVSCSTVNSNKRVSLILGVVRELARSGVQTRWTHIGGGPAFERLSSEASVIQENLEICLTGQLTGEESREVLRNGGFNVFVNLSLSEGAPVSVMEAQCLDIPVVATRVGGVREVAPEHLNVFVEVDSEVAEIAEAVVRAADLESLTRGQRRESWANNYYEKTNYESWCRELVELTQGNL
jgi:glycosyltransferase involved in cell wall biosynthesis